MDNIVIISLAYVGLPLEHIFAKKGYKVVGFDINQERVKELNSSLFDRILELSNVNVYKHGILKNLTWRL